MGEHDSSQNIKDAMGVFQTGGKLFDDLTRIAIGYEHLKNH
jgi:hypothetical protein